MTASAHNTGLGKQAGEKLQARLVDFVRLARANDYCVGVAEEIEAQRVATVCGMHDPQRLRWGLRALLCSYAEDWERFDELFDAYWLRTNMKSAYQSSPKANASRDLPAPASGNRRGPEPRRPQQADTAERDDGANVAVLPSGTREGASAAETMASADFQFLGDTARMREMERLVERLARVMRRRLLRRQRITRQGRRLHLRTTLRHCLRYGGMPMQLMYRKPRRRQPRLVVIVDVSRSMAMYSHLFLRFARGLVTAFADASAFAYHTRLVPITDALRQTDMSRLRASLSLISQGWSGGTRIGECLHHFNDQYGRLLNKRSVVIIVSDGLDTGEPSLLADQLRSVRQRCRRLIWLNPLLGREGYVPQTRGMRAALPHVDLFAPAHNLASLRALEPALCGL